MKARRYDLCMFDLDGTLINTLEALTYTTNLTLSAWGLRPITVEETKRIVGDGYKKQVERALRLAGDKELTHYEEALVRYMELFDRHCMHRVEPYPGIRKLLEELKKRGVRLAVFSNKPHAMTVRNIEGVFGEGYFDRILGQKEEIPKKPAPDGAWMIADGLGVDRRRCLYLGDTNTDMRTGKNAGFDTVGVTWGFRPREELLSFQPEFIADAPGDVIAMVEEND